MQATTVNDLPDWEPPELGLPQAGLVAILLVAAIIAFCIWIATDFGPKPLPQTIQVTQATLTQLPPPPTPPPPPKVVPPPKPIPAVIPKPPPVPSHIAVATKPPPPIHHIYKPVPHPVIRPAPPAPAKVQPPPPPSAAPAPPTNGVPIYGEQMYKIIQADQNVPPALAQLGVSGTAVIEIEVAPDGSVISASVYKSSGIPLIDQTALQHARRAHLPPFNSEMPNQPHAFLVPIEITPNTND